MRTCSFVLGMVGHLVFAVSGLAATVTFAPVSPNSVEAGTDVAFELTLSVTTLAAFDTADVLIGSDEAADVAFTYDAAWTSTIANVTTPVFDTGLYAQDVFVGGNHVSAVGPGMVLGTVTVATTGMTPGSYSVFVDHARDGVSTLGLTGVPESLAGTGTFTIVEVPQACCTPESCVIELPSICVNTGGEPQGQGATCADADSNGIADACEACLCQLYGDIAPPGPPDGNCVVDVDDILCVLDGFSVPELCTGADLAPCGGNGVIDVDDILAELDAFVGFFQCPHPCPP